MPPTKRLTSSPDPGPSRPPRPPNAWIMFRSDIWKALPPPPPGEAHLPQAVISKIIAKMWQKESPETRAYYEHKSEVQRAEHCARHPDYRFHPTKNAEKKRFRAQGLAKKRLRASQKAPPRTRPNTLQDPFTRTCHAPAGPASPTSVVDDPIFSELVVPAPSGLSLFSDFPPVATSSSSYPSLYPSPPSTTVIPPLVVPQPSMLQPSALVSRWPQDALIQPHEQDYTHLLLAQHQPQDRARFSLPEVGLRSPFTSLNPLFRPPLEIPLGWDPQDPSPATDRFYNESSMVNTSNNAYVSAPGTDWTRQTSSTRIPWQTY